MEQNLRFYVAKSIELAKTITIKSEQAALAINQGLTELGYVIDQQRPETWKYYLNLAGEYHESDERIEVKSLDTLETIEFSKDVLVNHRATREAYQPGTGFYQDLVDQYPDLQVLIFHITNPVDITTAIVAEDGDILQYPERLVDPNETNLIPRIEEWVKGFFLRWNNRAYSLVDELYVPAMLGVLWLTLPQAILSIRMGNISTARAHGFHIRETLASYQSLDDFYDFLTLDQRLFLYRNLDYIVHNAGHQETFDMLVENILTSRGIALVQYDTRQNHAKVPDEAFLPEVDLLGTNVNFKERNVYGFPESIEDLLDRQTELAYGNREVIDEAKQIAVERAKYSGSTLTPTKTLEARAEDDSARHEISLEHMLIHHWLYLSSKDQYQAVVPVTNPVTALDQSMSPKDAFVLYYYCFWRGEGYVLDTIPRFIAKDVQRHNVPTLSMAETWFGGPDYRLEILLDRYEPHYVVYDPLTFNERVKKIHRAFLNNTWLYKQENEKTANGRLRLITDRCLQTIAINLYEGEDYESWLRDRGVEVNDFNQYDFTIFAQEIMTAFTGVSLAENDSIRRVLNAMVQVMTRLSSYNVHYLGMVENDNYITLPWVTPRLDRPMFLGKSHVKLNATIPLDRVRIKNLSSVKGDDSVELISIQKRRKAHVELDDSVPLKSGGRNKMYRRLEHPSLQIRSVTITPR